MDWLRLDERGLFCEPAGVWLDPWRPVDRAVITHAHADHARPGNGHYLCTPLTEAVLKVRIPKAETQTLGFGEALMLGPVTLQFFPAGHIPGSAQVRLEYRGEVCVFTGDFKVYDDGLSEAFEPVICHRLITECTFGMPMFQWPDPQQVALEMREWVQENHRSGRASVLSVYSLGKAQRVMHVLRGQVRFWVHSAIDGLNRAYAAAGLDVPEYESIRKEGLFDVPTLILSAPAAIKGLRLETKGVSTAMASGWMGIRGYRKRSGFDRGFVLSDHADWAGLNQAVLGSGAERIDATHGYSELFARYWRERGKDARVLKTDFEGDGD